jgi:hypothetical protein
MLCSPADTPVEVALTSAEVAPDLISAAVRAAAARLTSAPYRRYPVRPRGRVPPAIELRRSPCGRSARSVPCAAEGRRASAFDGAHHLELVEALT